MGEYKWVWADYSKHLPGELKQRVNALTARVEALEKRAEPQSDLAPPKNPICDKLRAVGRIAALGASEYERGQRDGIEKVAKWVQEHYGELYLQKYGSPDGFYKTITINADEILKGGK